jgi:predicted Zn finger-like uncharacterized protein
MPYLFTCPHCQTRTLVDDRYSGQAGRCVTCGSAIALPPFAASQPNVSLPTQGTGGGTAAAWPIGQLSPLGRRLIAAVVCLVLVFCVAIALWRYGGPAIATMQTNRLRAESLRNIEKIALALNAYAADHGSYPLPRIDRPDGTPMHSWRVLLLPYLGEEALFNQYDLDQPWDSPENLQFAARVPSVYLPPGGAVFGTEAGYSLITGPGTLFPPAPPRGVIALGPRHVSDDPAQTLLVVQSLPPPNTYMSWTEPVDLDVRLMQGVLGGAPGREIGGESADGAVVATVDGRAHFLDARTSPLSVMALITIAGGEPLADDLLDR